MKHYRFDNRYTFMTGAIRAMEAKMLTPDIIAQLLKTNTVHDGMELLKNTYYHDFFKEKGKSENFSEMFLWKRNILKNFINKHSFHEEINTIFWISFDYHNIKVLLKKRIFELSDPLPTVNTGTIQLELLTDIFQNGNFDQLPYFMQKSITDAIELYYSTRHQILLDLVVDRIMYQDILNRCKQIESPIIYKYWKLNIDLINIQILFRSMNLTLDNIILEKLFIPDGNIETNFFRKAIDSPKEGIESLTDRDDLTRIFQAIKELQNNPFAIEKECDNTLTDHLRQTRYFIWGLETVFAFAIAVEIELKILGMIFSGLKAELDTQLIKMRLPEPF